MKAFLFDLNGTMIHDMDYHIRAWYHILHALGSDISMERMKEECYGKNEELLERMFPERFSPAEKQAMSFSKEQAYQQSFRPQLQLIAGLDQFLLDANAAGIALAIGSAAIHFNIDFVLDGLDIRQFFKAIVGAEDVQKSKPDPETYLRCAELLNLPVQECLVWEDSPKGVEAARRAGMQAVVITTLHPVNDFAAFDNIVAYISDYTNPLLLQQLMKLN
ncbi:MAG TPA: HAD family phosphatase [Sediminibacterium sp.]|nr:HAD family phosphatase [Sediminibacterium sp.]